MPFYTKSEKVKISALMQSDVSLEVKQTALNEIKSNANLRQEGYKKRVRVFLNALSNFKNNQVLVQE